MPTGLPTTRELYYGPNLTAAETAIGCKPNASENAIIHISCWYKESVVASASE